jgi:hypothetical protein
MTSSFRIAAAAALALLLAACVAGSGESAHAASGGLLSEFLLGIWHGVIAPVTLLVEILNRLFPRLLPWRAHLYEVRAAGAPYDLGFWLGLAGWPAIGWRRWSR